MRVHPTQDGMFTLLSRSVRTHLFCFYSLTDVKSFGEESPVEEFAGYGQQAIHLSLPKTRAFWPSSVNRSRRVFHAFINSHHRSREQWIGGGPRPTRYRFYRDALREEFRRGWSRGNTQARRLYLRLWRELYQARRSSQHNADYRALLLA